jgi:hypothetical protein
MNKMKFINKVIIVLLLSAVHFSCVDLYQPPTTEMGSTEFWETEADATFALMGAYSHVRGMFNRDYYFDGHADFVRVRDGSGNLSTTETNVARGAAYKYGLYFPDPAWGYGAKFDRYYQYLYGAVHRTNYVIENVSKMLLKAETETSRKNLETIIGEARLLRGMVYFRLISMWGDVPYIGSIIYDNSEVQYISRTSIKQIKDSIQSDFTYAFEKLPVKAGKVGRASKPAALAFRGKLNLYWASWNKNGWPELDTFTPNATEANTAFAAAAADFKSVIDDYGLRLYKNGDPGEWGELGKADVLPNYFHMFLPKTGNDNADGEMIFVFNHGTTGTGQGDALMRDFAGRNMENSQCWVTPYYRLADRYQSTITGDFANPLIPMNPNAPGARTAPNSAVNPQSYLNRDYRMKATMMWDYEMIQGLLSLQPNGWVPLIYKTWGAQVTINGEKYTSYNTDGTNSGYVFRKFVRNYPGAGRDDGDYNWPVMRLADVYLMYAEADNEINGPQPYAIELVNKVRRRGNLPALASTKVANRDVFFDAIEQERIIELIAEGHRSFDLRRWRAIERVWGPPGSDEVWMLDTHGGQQQSWFKNLTELQYQQTYIFKIPQSERDKNPNLTQNKPWL